MTRGLCMGAILFLCCFGTVSLHAADRWVTSIADAGAGSLRQALLDAGDGDVIDCTGVGGTITLIGGPLIVDDDVSILGPTDARLTVSGNNASRIFFINVGATAHIQNLTISGGYASGDGGGILNSGNLTLNKVTVSGNTAFGGNGGGICDYGTLVVTNSTVSGNHATGNGGGIDTVGGFTFNNITIHNNLAVGAGSAINATAGGAIGNSIVSEGCSGAGHFSDGHNIETDATCGLTDATDLQNTDPELGALADNGGPSWTHLPRIGSPAIDAGDDSRCESEDQRGFARAADGNGDGAGVCDIGASEYSPGYLQFNAADDSVSEDAGSIAVTVVRSGGGDGVASADYHTVNGTAAAGSDYTAASGTLNWNHRDTGDKAVVIPIALDLFSEPDETFSMVLSNFSGGFQGNPNAVAVTILDVSYPPALDTLAVTDIGTDAAVGGGDIADFGLPAPTAHGVCWDTAADPTTADTCTDEGPTTMLGAFTSTMTGLVPNTVYHCRAYATNAAGTAYGEDVVFITDILTPTVTTIGISNITQTSAEAAGSVDYSVPSGIRKRGIVWTTSPVPSVALHPATESGVGVGSFTGTLTDLAPYTTYYYRAYAQIRSGVITYTFYGGIKSFRTLSSPLDLDGDGLPNDWETAFGLNPNDPSDAALDTDGDGRDNLTEFGDGTDPTAPDGPDTDGDRLPDAWETLHGLNPNDPSDAALDTDGDGFNNLAEFINKTNPEAVDTDGDGTSDGAEWTAGTDPRDPAIAPPAIAPDADGDDVPDWYETANGLRPMDATDAGADADGDGLSNAGEFAAGTAPALPDSDGDGVEDGAEIDAGSDPLNRDSLPPPPDDADGDGMPDAWEIRNGLDPADPSDRGEDPDEDGLDNAGEYTAGADPADADSDDDGVQDGAEVAAGTDPVRADTDYDGLSDGAEAEAGTKPLDPDTDNDGATDGAEIAAGTDPLDADTDDDGMNDEDENDAGTDPLDPDSDDDGASDGAESAAGTDPLDPEDTPAEPPSGEDTDGDGMPDAWETGNGLDPDTDDAADDPDADGLTNVAEYAAGTDPKDADTDDDTMPDGWEANNDLDPADPSDATEDPDGDGATNLEEYLAGTNPNISNLPPSDDDADDDGMPDAWETANGLDPNDPSDADDDPDGDGVTNVAEYLAGSDPNVFNPPPSGDDADADGDGLPDAWETRNGLNPANAADAWSDPDRDGLDNLAEYGRGTSPRSADTDADGMIDGWEVANGLNPLDQSDAAEDPDNDGLDNRREHNRGTAPRNPDTDNDGMPDGWEVQNGLDPMNRDDGGEDPDGDGRINRDEYAAGTDPHNSNYVDTDGDGRSDRVERLEGTDPTFRDTLEVSHVFLDRGYETDAGFVLQVIARQVRILTTILETARREVRIPADEWTGEGTTENPYRYVWRPDAGSSAIADDTPRAGDTTHTVRFQFTGIGGIPVPTAVVTWVDYTDAVNHRLDMPTDQADFERGYGAASPRITRYTRIFDPASATAFTFIARTMDDAPHPITLRLPALNLADLYIADLTGRTSGYDADADRWVPDGLRAFSAGTLIRLSASYYSFGGDTVADGLTVMLTVADGPDAGRLVLYNPVLNGSANASAVAATLELRLNPDASAFSVLTGLEAADRLLTPVVGEYGDGADGLIPAERWFQADGAGRVAIELNHLSAWVGFIVEDADGDQLPDHWEREYGLDPSNPADARENPDGDAADNLAEFTANTNPNVADNDIGGIDGGGPSGDGGGGGGGGCFMGVLGVGSGPPWMRFSLAMFVVAGMIRRRRSSSVLERNT